jgi:HSP20 family protein
MSILEPFTHPFEELRKQMDKYFSQHDSLASSLWKPTLDIIERENQIIIKMDLPGVNKEDLELSFEDGAITARGERKYEKKTGENEVWRKTERFYGKFVRSIPIHKGVKQSDIQASFENGVLEIKYNIPPEARQPAVKIPIKAKL